MPSRSTGIPGIMSGIRLAQAVPGMPPSWRPPMPLISPMSYEALGEDLAGMFANAFASTTHPGANIGTGYPFELSDYFLVQKVWWMNGTTVGTDTIDVAVYTEAGGASSRLVAGGGAVAAGANAIQEIDCTDTLLAPGRYWCVHAQSGVTATTMASGTPGNTVLRGMGVAFMAAASSGGVLGTTWTPGSTAQAYLPLCGIAGRSQAA